MLMKIVYNLGWLLSGLCGWPILLPFIGTSLKRRKTVMQRLWLPGFSPEKSAFNPAASGEKPIWVHALSVGEVLSAAPLIKALREAQPQKGIVFSVSTLSGFDIAGRTLKQDVNRLVYFPYDLLFSVRRAFNVIDPACVVMIESDVWPNFILEVKRRRIPAFFVNARLSDRSFKRYRQFAFLSKPLFSAFTKICCQSAHDAGRFKRLGVPSEKIVITGNIKFDQLLEDTSADNPKTIREMLDIPPEQPVLIAGSTHANEEEILLEALRLIKKDFPELLLIVAPRDTARSESIQALFRHAGFLAACLREIPSNAAGGDRKIMPDVIIIDRIGLLRKLYTIADIAFVGGSLVALGGHNPLEPAIFSKPVLFGPYMSNFKEISHKLLDQEGALIVPNAVGLHRTAIRLLTDKGKAQAIGRRAFNVFCGNRGAVEKTLTIIASNSKISQ